MWIIKLNLTYFKKRKKKMRHTRVYSIIIGPKELLKKYYLEIKMNRWMSEWVNKQMKLRRRIV